MDGRGSERPVAHTQQKLAQVPPGKEISIFLLGTWNLYSREIIFVNDVAVLTIETTKLVFKPAFLKQFRFLKPWISL